MKNTRIIDLQLFATEKTEKATPKKRKDAREKGQVFKSFEFSSAVTLLVLFIALRLAFPHMIAQFKSAYIRFLDIRPPFDQIYSAGGLQMMGLDVLIMLGVIAAPISVFALVLGLAINYWQVGFLFTGDTLVPKLSRINPIEGFKRMFSLRTLTELLKSTLKVIIVAVIAYQEYMTVTRNLPGLLDLNVSQGAAFIGNSIYNLSIRIGVGLLILAILDYIYQWWEYEKSLRMSKQEIKDEYKQMEGDPQIRSKIKEKQRQMGLRRMMQQVPNADVVVTNPTHYAVALRYEPSLSNAPVVVAKGLNLVALRIKEIAQKSMVTIVENPPLAQVLYSSSEVGQSIPADLFHAVAEVLAYVYSIKGKNNS